MSWPTAFMITGIVWAMAFLLVACLAFARNQCPDPEAHTAGERG